MADELFNTPYGNDGPLLQFLGSIDETLVGTIAAALQEAGGAWNSQLRAMAEVFARKLGNPADMLAVHEKVAALAQDSVKRSYDQLVTAREGWASRTHYRQGATDWEHRRYAGGVMRRALGDEDFMTVSAEGIGFGNVEMLNRKAAQWHRLAFGAGPRGSGATERIQVIWQDVVAATFGFSEPASPGFVVPRGVWLGPEGPVRAGKFAPGSDAFYPAREAPDGTRRYLTRKIRTSRGIEAKHFMEAGLRRMARELPVAYGHLYDEWWEEGLHGPLGQVTSVVPSITPGGLRSRSRSRF